MFYSPSTSNKAYTSHYPNSRLADAATNKTYRDFGSGSKSSFKVQPQREDAQSDFKQRQQFVSEIVIPANFDSLQLILPSLAYLSHQSSDRWLTWITQSPLPIEQLKQFNFNLNNFRVIYAKSQQQVRDLLCSPLIHETSHTVIASPGRLNATELESIELLASTSASKSVLVRLNEF